MHFSYPRMSSSSTAVQYPSALYNAPSGRFRDALRTSKRAGYYSRMPRSLSVAPNLRSSSSSAMTTLPMLPSASTRAFLRNALDDLDATFTFRRTSKAGERNRDDLIDSIIFNRTRENRVMPGFIAATNWDERRSLSIDCDKVYPGIYLCNGDTVQNLDYLKSIGITHVLNTAERHVPVNPGKYTVNNISYYGFHVDDHPSSNISRYFTRCSEFIDDALRRGGNVMVNCVMGWSRSATVVAAYLISKKGMTSVQALDQIKQNRPVRPNPGFLQQLANFDNLSSKKLVWDSPL